MAETKTGRKRPTGNPLQQKRNGTPPAHETAKEKGRDDKQTDGKADDQGKCQASLFTQGCCVKILKNN
jgi:hypothetical protein